MNNTNKNLEEAMHIADQRSQFAQFNGYNSARLQ